ncbi:hypothetical protein [Nocardia transvalensis]|uniref:hypothetical protein n=1 Tax=Nocardia transvalensis TaxID=37333 RepID=UPI001894DE02|nr:hypothetical protein [Nocardia transvalensis]MBF6333616.1 hypothetical protein [Nocardia transvalensis]
MKESDRWTPGWSREAHTWIDPWSFEVVQDLLIEAAAVGWDGFVVASDLPHALLVDDVDGLLDELWTYVRGRYRRLWEGQTVSVTPILLIVGAGTYAADRRIEYISRWGHAVDLHLAVDYRVAATEQGLVLCDRIAGMRRGPAAVRPPLTA